MENSQNAYVFDKNCIVCNCKFGNIGFTTTKKYFCKVCFRGVCEKCSGNRIDGIRSCDKCYESYLAKNDVPAEHQIRPVDQNEQLYGQKIRDIQVEIESLTRKIEDIDNQRYVNEENLLVQVLLAQKSDLFDNINSKKLEISKKTKELEEIKNKLENTEKDLEIAKEKNLSLEQELISKNLDQLSNPNLLINVLNDLEEKIKEQKNFIEALNTSINKPKESTESIVIRLEAEKLKSELLAQRLKELHSSPKPSDSVCSFF